MFRSIENLRGSVDGKSNIEGPMPAAPRPEFPAGEDIVLKKSREVASSFLRNCDVITGCFMNSLLSPTRLDSISWDGWR